MSWKSEDSALTELKQGYWKMICWLGFSDVEVGDGSKGRLLLFLGWNKVTGVSLEKHLSTQQVSKKYTLVIPELFNDPTRLSSKSCSFGHDIFRHTC